MILCFPDAIILARFHSITFFFSCETFSLDFHLFISFFAYLFHFSLLFALRIFDVGLK